MKKFTHPANGCTHPTAPIHTEQPDRAEGQRHPDSRRPSTIRTEKIHKDPEQLELPSPGGASVTQQCTHCFQAPTGRPRAGPAHSLPAPKDGGEAHFLGPPRNQTRNPQQPSNRGLSQCRETKLTSFQVTYGTDSRLDRNYNIFLTV